MNYRHAFHAGNFADVLKHAVLSRILVHLGEKPAPFRLIDTHAGAGRYDLTGREASTTQEWRHGIGCLLEAHLGAEASELLQPYLKIIREINSGGPIRFYPGSPELGRALLRGNDRLLACELEPQALRQLEYLMRRDRRVKVMALDGWVALNASIPPRERRGVVLIDPPFEQPGEFDRMAQALISAHRKWSTGSYVLWYPVKNPEEARSFVRKLVRSGIQKMLRLELRSAPTDSTKLHATGLILVNPPWRLESELKVVLPALASALGQQTQFQLEWLSTESSPYGLAPARQH